MEFQSGTGRSVVHVAKTDEAALRSYERLGYVRCGETIDRFSRVDEDGLRFQAEVDCWVMEKPLP
jgi:hypothetical protein